MSASTNFRSPTSSDARILIALKNIANELEQDEERCGVRVTVMSNYGNVQEFPLSQVHSQPFAEHAKEHEGATWDHVSITFEALQLHVTLNRDREHGEDQIDVSYNEDPSDPVEVSRSLIAIQRQFIPLNRAAEIERALGPEMAEFYRRRERAMAGLELGLKARHGEPVAEVLDAAKRHIGELSMEIELLRERARAAEQRLPLAMRRSRR